jgi:hypothetical protein
MRRLPRLLATTAVAAGAITIAPLSTTLGAPASAATASFHAVGAWVYPGKLVLTVSGTPEKPYSVDPSGIPQHDVVWDVYLADPTQACPATPDSLDYSEDIADSADFGGAKGTSFSKTINHPFSPPGGYHDEQPAHLCGYLTEGDTDSTSGSTITATSDTVTPARVRNWGVRINGGGYYLKKQYHLTVIGQCQDIWPNGKVWFTTGCPLAAKVVLTVSKRVQHQLGLSSRLLGSVKLVPYTGTVERTELVLTAAGKKATSHWGDSDVAQLKGTSTAPIAMTRTKTTGLTTLFGFDSWKTSTNDSGGD